MISTLPELYSRHDALTDPGVLAGLYDDLPDGLSALRDIVSYLIVHVSWAARYGISPDTPMPRDTQPVSDRLKLIQAMFPGPLGVDRSPEKRASGGCRDDSLMLCSILRQRSIPARVRCGFATYFGVGPFEDHWICECWSAEARRWIRVDAQQVPQPRGHRVWRSARSRDPCSRVFRRRDRQAEGDCSSSPDPSMGITKPLSI